MTCSGASLPPNGLASVFGATARCCLLDYQYVKIDFVDKSLAELENDSPLDLYCSYTSDQILVALGKL